MTRLPIDDGLFTWPSDDPRLLGSRCARCELTAFPAQYSCPGCGGTSVERVELPARGTLWSWTTQSFPPIAPPYRGKTDTEFEPFGIGWVSLSDRLMIEARLTENNPNKLEFGMPVELTFFTIANGEDGTEVVSFAFQPVA